MGNRIKEACADNNVNELKWCGIPVIGPATRTHSKHFTKTKQKKNVSYGNLTIHHRIKVYALNSLFSHSIALLPHFFLFSLNGNYAKFMLGKLA